MFTELCDIFPRRSHVMKIRGTIGGLISSASAGDFSILLSSYSSSQDDEVSLARSDELETPIIGLSSELSRLFPVVRKHFPLLIVLTVRAKKFLSIINMLLNLLDLLSAIFALRN